MATRKEGADSRISVSRYASSIEKKRKFSRYSLSFEIRRRIHTDVIKPSLFYLFVYSSIGHSKDGAIVLVMIHISRYSRTNAARSP